MINLVKCSSKNAEAKFIGEREEELGKISASARRFFKGEYLQTAFVPEEDKILLLVGTGKKKRDHSETG